MMDWDISALRADRLSDLVPVQVYTGGEISYASKTLCIWRTCRFPATARGGVLGFYVDDFRFECLWNRPTFYAEQFASFGWGAVVEPDFSTWANAPLVEQLWSIYRMRTLGRLYQEHGLRIIPNLAWSDERSFEFAFSGIPRGCPVAFCEARTAGSTDNDRRRFLAGLAEGVRQVQPEHILVYGGKEHAFWLRGRLPAGPHYTLLESWTSARDRARRSEARRQKNRQQCQLFPNGGDRWADEAAAAVAAAAVAGHA